MALHLFLCGWAVIHFRKFNRKIGSQIMCNPKSGAGGFDWALIVRLKVKS
jgi:hypothetical protein